MRRVSITVMCVGLVAGCGPAWQAQEAGTVIEDRLAELLAVLPGRYEAAADAVAGRPGVYHVIDRVSAPLLGDVVMYHEVGSLGEISSVMQRKFYAFDATAGDEPVTSASYVVRGQELSDVFAVGREALTALRPDQMLQFPRACRLRWKRIDTGRFEASISDDTCRYESAAFEGYVRPWMNYVVDNRFFALTETLFDDTGDVLVSTGGTIRAERVGAD